MHLFLVGGVPLGDALPTPGKTPTNKRSRQSEPQQTKLVESLKAVAYLTHINSNNIQSRGAGNHIARIDGLESKGYPSLLPHFFSNFQYEIWWCLWSLQKSTIEFCDAKTTF